MSFNANKHRRRWTMAETEFLLTRYLARIGDMRPRRKMKVFRDLAQDIMDSGIARLPVTSEEVQNKIKSLLRSYKDGVEGFGSSSIRPGHPFYVHLKQIIESPTSPIHARTRAAIFKSDQKSTASSPSSIIINESTDEVPELFERVNVETVNEATALPGTEESVVKIAEVEEEESEDFSGKAASRFIEKRELIKYREDRKDKRLRMKLDFLREKERNKQRFYDKEQHFYNESIGILREIKDIVQTAFSKNCGCQENIDIKMEPI